RPCRTGRPRVVSARFSFWLSRAGWFPVAGAAALPRRPGTARCGAGSGVEVLRLGVVHHDGVGGLLRVQLVLLGEGHADALRLQQLDELRPVLQVGAGPVAEREARAAVFELE